MSILDKVRKKAALFFESFSNKQMRILTWWTEDSPYKDFNGIICDGAIRAGKTVPMAISFVFWAMDTFESCSFGMCGKSIGSFHRNVWTWLKPALIIRGYRIKEVRTGEDKHIDITFRGVTNKFYIFGGKDERSQDLIQGVTLAGILFDEVALMPESFVNQGTGRCSVEGAKFWFNCNPDGPMHWFNLNWLEKAAEKKLLHIHFIMDDNPSLSEKMKQRYKDTYCGVFFQRFILGLWVVAQGAIYKDAWSEDVLFDDSDMEPGLRNNPSYNRYILIDYGTVNPCVFLDVIDDMRTWWIVNEYYYDSRDDKNKGVEKSNEQYGQDLIDFIGDKGIPPTCIVIDPSAASFKVTLRSLQLRSKETIETVNADNEVLDGIRMVSSMLHRKLIRIHRKNCPMTKLELLSYVWDDEAIKKGQKEKPIKLKDHCPDALRYGVKTLIKPRRLAS
ncbi:phage terminase, large subunit, PBSX family [Desulfitobacterium hafniense DP7]|uniref:Phage terminase, large subunit, PBSX family n=1 Tax=Desulfitobacterium hafniense DP7 TaxID=537010 RepID=G9XHI7_DESHA|nr:PBSX family phage terminase large subunit [Desulfitobacterium hafniense]EHL08989.1 phage terminase, large subunit, PBSX family [Desulfitobacterium hafniense DP7]